MDQSHPFEALNPFLPRHQHFFIPRSVSLLLNKYTLLRWSRSRDFTAPMPGSHVLLTICRCLFLSGAKPKTTHIYLVQERRHHQRHRSGVKVLSHYEPDELIRLHITLLWVTVLMRSESYRHARWGHQLHTPDVTNMWPDTEVRHSYSSQQTCR